MTELREKAYQALIDGMIDALPEEVIEVHATLAFQSVHRDTTPEVWAEVLKIAKEQGERHTQALEAMQAKQ